MDEAAVRHGLEIFHSHGRPDSRFRSRVLENARARLEGRIGQGGGIQQGGEEGREGASVSNQHGRSHSLGGD